MNLKNGITEKTFVLFLFVDKMQDICYYIMVIEHNKFQ